MGRNNLLAVRVRAGLYLQGRLLMDGVVEPDGFDCAHELTIVHECVRVGAHGFQDGNLADMVIVLPAVLNFTLPSHF